MSTLSLFAAAILLYPSRFLIAADEPVATSVQHLLANPADFNGKRIAITGYYMTGFEHCALYSDGKVANTFNPAKSIWIDLTTAKLGPSSQQSVRHGYVRVVGTFQHTS